MVMDYFNCPHCAGEVPERALCCPHCGSDSKTGWSEYAETTGYELPDEEDYEDLLHSEFGIKEPMHSAQLVKRIGLGVIAMVLIVAFILGYLQ
jgi:hypothetical protein